MFRGSHDHGIANDEGCVCWKNNGGAVGGDKVFSPSLSLLPLDGGCLFGWMFLLVGVDASLFEAGNAFLASWVCILGRALECIGFWSIS